MRRRPTYPVLLAMDAPANDAAQTGAIALAVTDAFVIPAYRRLAEATSAQEQAWVLFSRDRTAANLEQLRVGYHAAADAWAAAQIIHTGPIVLFLRYERFAYWPEARNATQRALDTLLSSQDPDDLLSENLASNSVAGQGLTALERILFDGDDPVTALTSEGMDAEWRAAVGLALSRNVNGIANEVLTDWVVEGGMRASIAAGNGWNNLFADGAEAARLLLTDLVGAFQLMNDGKLLPVLGDSIDTARPRMAEAWRSGRPQRNLAENLAAVREMTMSFAAFTSEPRRAVLLASLDAAAMAIAAVPDDMGEAAADPARRPLVQAAFDALKIAQAEAADILPEDLGITLGFNALDGD
ncbi:MAG: hypothetical protein RJB62_1297 [Pseudomonadota bacterium]|jgi:predicted lipoprotein